MTTGHGDGTGAGGYGSDSEYDPYRAAVDALADPLNDPLPGQQPQQQPPQPEVTPQPGPVAADALYGAEADQEPAWYAAAPREAYDEPYQPYEAYVEPVQQAQQQPQPQPQQPQPVQPPQQVPTPAPRQPDPQQFVQEPDFGRPQVPEGGHDPYAAGRYQPSEPETALGGERGRTEDGTTVRLRRPHLEALARRTGVEAPRGRPHTERPPGPSRLEARRAARALRPGPGIIASRAIGEVFITCGVLMLLFVAYQLWWTNVLANQQAGGATDQLHKQWDEHKPGDGTDPRKAGAFKPGEGFAIIHMPKIDVTAPIAQGISKTKVLDKGMVGHYDEKPLKTAMPWDKKGNFALAGHRNTHGEPFRYINKLKYGDVVVVETQSKYYTYKVTRQLPSTSPSDTGVIGPVPPKSGYTKPGRYITLTTCTPEYTSKYRLIVWGIMVDERPRSKGKPDALVD
ncbi:class E sortase [Streptomyces sp. 3N207]|uniref:class E sortase n=1 Tax=Streptomyces sp. 3N207 TaxID=3457417 RepID=UPI003FD1E2C8